MKEKLKRLIKAIFLGVQFIVYCVVGIIVLCALFVGVCMIVPILQMTLDYLF